MTPEQYQRVTDLFLKAVELETAERASFLEDACKDDPQLRRDVDSLLTHDSDNTLIESSPAAETIAELAETVPAAVRVGQEGRTSRWLETAKLTRYLSPRGQFALGAVSAVVLVLSVTFVAGYGIDEFQRKLRSAALQEILDAKIAGLEMWIEHEHEKVASWARSNELRQLIEQVVEYAGQQPTPEMLRMSPLQELLRKEMHTLAGEEASYQLWNRSHTTIADEPQMKAVGSGVTSFGGSVLAEVFRGKSFLMTYDRDEQITIVESAIHNQPRSGTLAPIYSSDGEIMAALLVIDEDASEQVARIFRLADLGTSGETYAFNNDGHLLTESRFNDQLKSIGVLPEGGSSAGNVILRDPGGDMTTGYRPSEPLAVQPLTKMAQYATAGIDGVDVHGYRDYRGIEVVGAWRWLDEYGLGVATEIDKGEMEPGLWIVVAQAWIILGLFTVCLGIVLYSYYSLLKLRSGEHSRIGKYTLEKMIGEGGMGRVFKARHEHLKRPTALKLLKPDLSNADNIARFEREAQLASQLTHPNTIQIHDYGVTDEGLFYYVMEFVDGPSFAKEVSHRGALPPRRVVHLLKQVCGSLIEAHDAGLIHRDLKPLNILLCKRGGEQDVVKVVDFGLVKHLGGAEDQTATATGVLAGTPLYIAPERLRDPTIAAATTDIYSLGGVAFFMLTGQDIFQGRSLADLLFQAANTEPARASEIVSEIPEQLDQLVADCLSKRPEDRPQTVAEVLERLTEMDGE